MIFKIDHIALASSDINSDIAFMRKLEYEPVFNLFDIPNPEGKKPFMDKYSPIHDAALLASEGGVCIELIDHKYLASGTGRLIPVFENIPGVIVPKDKDTRLSQPGGRRTVRFEKLSVPTPLLTVNDGGRFNFNKVVFYSTDVARSRLFWEYCGFKFFQDVGGGIEMRFQCLFSGKPFSLYIENIPLRNEQTFLNDRGFNCMAFISNRIEEDKKNFEDNSFTTTSIEKVNINGRDLSVFFASGLNGEFAEIIGPVN